MIAHQPESTLAASFDRVLAHRRLAQAKGELFFEPTPPGPTSALVRGMRSFIRDRNIRSIVDVSVGEMSWWTHVLGDVPQGAIRFYGFDICRGVVQQNREEFIERPDWQFEVADARFHDYPPADLTVCRRTLNHLWSLDATTARANIARRTRLLALTHNPEIRANRPDGMRRPYADDTPRATTYVTMNLRRPPFMPMPMIASIQDEDDELLGIFPARTQD